MLGDRRISVKGCLSVSRDVLKSARDLCELATGTFVPTGRDSGLVACWAGYRAARCGPLYVNVDRAVVSAAPLTAGQERLLAFAVGFETGPKLVSAKTKGRISIRVEVNEDKLVRALIRDGFLRQFQALDGDRAAIERAAGRAIDLWAAYSKTD